MLPINLIPTSFGRFMTFILLVYSIVSFVSCTATEASLADKKFYTGDNTEYRNRYEATYGEGEKPIRYGYNYIVSTVPEGFKVRVYHPQKKTLIEEKTYSTSALSMLHGFYRSYWDDGSIHEQGTYQFGRKHGLWLEAEPYKGKSASGEYQNQRKEGLWTQLDSNGMVESVYNWHDGKRHGKFFLYDVSGEKINEGLFKNDTLVAELFKQPLITEPYLKTCESNPLFDVYTCTQNTLNLMLANELRYPTEAKKHKIEGKAFVQWDVDPEGHVKNIRVPSALSDDIEEEIKRVIQRLPPYQPATKDGVPIKHTVSLPLQFAV